MSETRDQKEEEISEVANFPQVVSPTLRARDPGRVLSPASLGGLLGNDTAGSSVIAVPSFTAPQRQPRPGSSGHFTETTSVVQFPPNVTGRADPNFSVTQDNRGFRRAAIILVGERQEEQLKILHLNCILHGGGL